MSEQAVDQVGQDGVTPALSGDVVILGGGLVGMTLAIGLAKKGLSSLVVDSSDPAAQTAQGFDGRASAISTASWNLYTNLGMAEALAPRAARSTRLPCSTASSPVASISAPSPRKARWGACMPTATCAWRCTRPPRAKA
jgi:2-octaprenyl-6-methoxyphenol hydroxylase